MDERKTAVNLTTPSQFRVLGIYIPAIGEDSLTENWRKYGMHVTLVTKTKGKRVAWET